MYALWHVFVVLYMRMDKSDHTLNVAFSTTTTNRVLLLQHQLAGATITTAIHLSILCSNALLAGCHNYLDVQ
jgi:hypothetical protein